MEQRFTLTQLASAAQVSERTVRLYISRGILPPADRRFAHIGPYSTTHLHLLREARAILDNNMTLDDVRDRLHPIPDDDPSVTEAADARL